MTDRVFVDEIVKFADTMGIKLAPWQEYVMKARLGEDMSTTDIEIEAIDTSHEALSQLDHDARLRALRYLIARLDIGLGELQQR